MQGGASAIHPGIRNSVSRLIAVQLISGNGPHQDALLVAPFRTCPNTPRMRRSEMGLELDANEVFALPRSPPRELIQCRVDSVRHQRGTSSECRKRTTRMNDYVALVLGFIIAGVGGELFVRGAVGLAKWVRISPGIIGATVVAFATSSPELSVAVNAGMAGKPEIALGDALGSNVVNVSLILALALIVSGILCPRDNVKRDFPMALLIPLVTGALALDGQLSRIDGLLLLILFLVWLLAAVHEARKQRHVAEEDPDKQRGWLNAVWFAMGLGLLIAAGTLIVTGAQGIAQAFGIEAFVIGATIVAVGTSVPELATAVIAKIRGHDEVGLGTVLGSNIFNGG